MSDKLLISPMVAMAHSKSKGKLPKKTRIHSWIWVLSYDSYYKIIWLNLYDPGYVKTVHLKLNRWVDWINWQIELYDILLSEDTGYFSSKFWSKTQRLNSSVSKPICSLSSSDSELSSCLPSVVWMDASGRYFDVDLTLTRHVTRFCQW